MSVIERIEHKEIEGVRVGRYGRRRLLGREDLVGVTSLGHFSKHNLIAACLSDDGSTRLAG